MKKSILEFSKMDWDTLFPVKLVDHNPNWKHIYEAERQNILQAIDNKYFKQIEHFGSSCIPDIRSKPYIDILIEIPVEYLFDPNLIVALESIGYTCLTQRVEDDENNYMILVKGYNVDGTSKQVFHLHACPPAHPLLEQLEFRNYLLDNPQHAGEYEKLKIKLEKEFRNDRVSYRIAKTDFIEDTLKFNRKIEVAHTGL